MVGICDITIFLNRCAVVLLLSVTLLTNSIQGQLGPPGGDGGDWQPARHCTEAECSRLRMLGYGPHNCICSEIYFQPGRG